MHLRPQLYMHLEVLNMARRRWLWLGHEQSIAISAGNTGIGEVLPESTIEKGMTIARVVGDVIVTKTTPDTAVRGFGMGLIMSDEGSVVAGVPTPLVDYDADWLWLRNGWLRPDAAGDVGMREFLVDNRSMRKIDGDKRLLFVHEAAAVGMNFAFCFRIGIKLP